MKLSQKIKPIKQLIVGADNPEKSLDIKGFWAKISDRILSAFYLNIKF